MNILPGCLTGLFHLICYGEAGYKAENKTGGVGVSLVPEPKMRTEGLGVSADQKKFDPENKDGGRGGISLERPIEL